MNPKLKGWLLMLLRVAISGALLWWVVQRMEGDLDALRRVSIIELVPAAIVFTVSTVLGALQWTLILRHAGMDVSPGRLHALYWVGMFFNNFLPSNVGGDLVKVADVSMTTGRVARPIAGTLLDRALGLSALAALAFVAGALLREHAPAGLPWWALTAVAVPVIAGTGAILSGRAGRLLTLLVDRLRPGPGRGRLRQLLGVLQDYRSHPRFVLRIAALALLVQAMRVSTHVLVTRAMGLSLEPERILQLYVLVPVLALAVVLPISFNGLGVRELVAQRLMPAIGISAESAVAMQLITYFVQVTVSLIGGVVFAVMMIRGQLRMRRGDPEGI